MGLATEVGSLATHWLGWKHLRKKTYPAWQTRCVVLCEFVSYQSRIPQALSSIVPKFIERNLKVLLSLAGNNMDSLHGMKSL